MKSMEGVVRLVLLKNLGILFIGLLIGGVAVSWGYASRPDALHFETPYQAVLLDTGQAYYGKVSGTGSPYLVLRDVYYVQARVDPQTKQSTNILIRRGKEWHGPDLTILSASHVVMIEPVGPTSTVAKLIAEQEKQK